MYNACGRRRDRCRGQVRACALRHAQISNSLYLPPVIASRRRSNPALAAVDCFGANAPRNDDQLTVFPTPRNAKAAGARRTGKERTAAPSWKLRIRSGALRNFLCRASFAQQRNSQAWAPGASKRWQRAEVALSKWIARLAIFNVQLNDIDVLYHHIIYGSR